MAIGVLAGLARVHGPQSIIWIDAHADLNTPATSPTGNLHGMSVAVALGEAADIFPLYRFPTPAVDLEGSGFVGLRPPDPDRRDAPTKRGFTFFTISELDTHGTGNSTDQRRARSQPQPRRRP